MIKNTRTLRSVSLALIIVGGILIFLALGDIWVGVLLRFAPVAGEGNHRRRRTRQMIDAKAIPEQ